MTLASVLQNFSVAQVYNFIWRAGRDAAAFYQRGGVTRSHAANTVIGTIQRNADRARAEEWDVKPYRRDRRAPRSMVSEVLFDTALQVGELAFNAPLRVVEQIKSDLQVYVRGVPPGGGEVTGE